MPCPSTPSPSTPRSALKRWIRGQSAGFARLRIAAARLGVAIGRLLMLPFAAAFAAIRGLTEFDAAMSGRTRRGGTRHGGRSLNRARLRRRAAAGCTTLLLGALSSGAQAQPSAPPVEPGAPVEPADVQARLARLEDQLGRMAREAGVPVALYAEQGGDVKVERYWNCGADTRFRWGSVSKQLTATAIASLVEAGDLHPSQRIVDLYGLVPDQLADPRVADIELHHLLTHTSGLPAATSGLDNPLSGWDAAESLTQVLEEVQLERAPGSAFGYSNLGFDVLGEVVERASGAPLGEFVQTRFFEGLALESIAPAPGAANIAAGHVFSPVGSVAVENGPDGVMATPAAGGFVSRPRDLARWVRAVMAGQVVSPATLRTMLTGAAEMPGNSAQYGWGWIVGDIEGLGPIASHAGALSPTGHQTAVFYLGGTDTVVVVQAGLDVSSLKIGGVSTDVLLWGEGGEAKADPWTRMAVVAILRLRGVFILGLVVASLLVAAAAMWGTAGFRLRAGSAALGTFGPLLAFQALPVAIAVFVVAAGFAVGWTVWTARRAPDARALLRADGLGVFMGLGSCFVGLMFSAFFNAFL